MPQDLRAFRDIATLRIVDVQRPPDRATDIAAGARAAARFGLNRLSERLAQAEKLSDCEPAFQPHGAADRLRRRAPGGAHPSAARTSGKASPASDKSSGGTGVTGTKQGGTARAAHASSTRARAAARRLALPP